MCRLVCAFFVLKPPKTGFFKASVFAVSFVLHKGIVLFFLIDQQSFMGSIWERDRRCSVDHSISSRQSHVIIDDVGWGGEDHDRYSQVLGHLGRSKGQVSAICACWGKICLWGFRPGHTQMSVLSYRD